ncbi:hypothetical protein BZA05DRAFT_405911 [Tricharina praecox]|uniref:uncharacterized protein n=1 Tax=Tricharina praecox TaxID=43433 RepID=UPI002220E2D2|nr:uncharacterized protein BZA05DRAFT_405911 [Tricharina praecox]KAI5846936.1 hypothetical protein BZA05DRAFT_405911 [Tricharina praecox]
MTSNFISRFHRRVLRHDSPTASVLAGCYRALRPLARLITLPAQPTMQALQIPTVTIHDLAAFHHSHLCQSADFSTCSPLCDADSGDVEEVFEEQEEQDDLVYYPDGVKRTLTDAQVAMFRFSEIQQLLKQKRREDELAAKKRKRKRDDADVDPSEIPQPARVSREDVRKNRLEAALWAAKHDWDVFGNPVDAPTEPGEFVAEVQGDAESGKTFLWPKIEQD